MLSGSRTKRTELLKMVPGIILLIFGLLYDLRIYINPGKWFLDNDMSSEIVLADMLNREGTIFSKNWLYSTELRILCQQWFLRIGLWLYPGNWHRARMIGALLMVIVGAIVFYLFFKCMQMPMHWAIVATAVMVWPFGQDYYLFVIWGLYYLSHITLLALGFYVFHKLIDAIDTKQKNKAIILVIINVALSVVNGLGGIRMTYVFYAPLLFTSLLMFGFQVQNNPESAKNIKGLKELKAVCLAFILFIADVVGFFINTHVLTKIYSFANLGGYFKWKEEFDYSVEEILRNYVFQFGYQKKANVLTFEGISTVFGLGFALLVIVCSIRLLFRLKELSFVQRMVIIFYHCSFLIHFVMLYCFAGSSNYWLTIMPFAIAVVFVELSSEKFILVATRKVALVLVTFMVICCSIATVNTQRENSDFASYSVYQAVEWLEDNGYTEGYAPCAKNVLTELSNGNIQVWPTETLYGNTSGIWLTKKDMLETKPEGKCFILHYSVTDGPVKDNPLLKNGKQEFENGYYTIWTFDSVDEMLSGL